MDKLANDFAGMPIGRWWIEHRVVCLVLTYAAVAALLAIPILVANVPLGVDDIEHLARIYVRAHIGTDPDLAHLFEIRTDPIPYLGMDLLLTPLARLLPIMVVGRIFVLVLVWGLVGAGVVLQRTFTSRVGLSPAASGLIAYNGLIAWGLINYVLGLILALLAFAAWHGLRARPWLMRLIFFTSVATALYFTHLLAFVLYGVLVVSYELFGRQRPWRTPLRDWILLAGQAVPGLILWHSLGMSMLGTQSAIYYRPVAKLFALEASTAFGRAAGRTFDTGLVSFIFCSVALFMAARRGLLTWPRSLAAPALILLGLTILLPYRLMGVYLIETRFSVAAACLALAGLKFKSIDTSHALMAVVAVALLMISHVVDVSIVMRRCDGQYAELRRALAVVPRGATLVPVLERSAPVPGVACTALPIYDHIASLVTIDRSGYATNFFARATTVALRDGRLSDIDPPSAETFATAPMAGYVLWIHLGHRRPVPPGLALLWSGSFFDLWAVKPHSQS